MQQEISRAAEAINERFATALSELIAMCMEAGMHTSEMIKPMEKELKWMREQNYRDDPRPSEVIIRADRDDWP